MRKVQPWLASPVAILASTAAVYTPFIHSFGLSFNQVLVNAAAAPKGGTGLVVLIWLLSAVAGCARAHETVLTCIIDSIGIPAILLFAVGIDPKIL